MIASNSLFDGKSGGLPGKEELSEKVSLGNSPKQQPGDFDSKLGFV